MEEHKVFLYFIVVVCGLVTGSFLNVVIYRLPRNLSIIRPGSRCPECSTPIKAFDNIPVLSFLLLKGRCRVCRTRISWKYPLVEFLNGLMWFSGLYKFGYSFSILPVILFLSSMIVIAFIDLEHMIIPDVITIPGVILGLGVSPFIPDPFFSLESLGITSSLTGAIMGFLLFLIIATAGTALFKKEAMGGGDIKLMAMVGAFTGWKGVLLTTFIGSLVGSIVGIIIILKNKKANTIIPFGPYLAIGAILSILFGQEIWNLVFRSEISLNI